MVDFACLFDLGQFLLVNFLCYILISCILFSYSVSEICNHSHLGSCLLSKQRKQNFIGAKEHSHKEKDF